MAVLCAKMNMNDIKSSGTASNPHVTVVSGGYVPKQENDLHAEIVQLIKQIEYAVLKEREDCAKLLDDEADRQERVWREYVKSGREGPAMSFHSLPRYYAALIRARSIEGIEK